MPGHSTACGVARHLIAGKLPTEKEPSVDVKVVNALDELVRELDMLVYQLEGEVEIDLERMQRERSAIRREVERLRDTLWDVVRSL